MTEAFSGSEALHEVLRKAGVSYDHYKIRCIERRLAARMRARGVHSYEDYARLLQLDPGESGRLAQALTINVTRFFRNWPAFETLAAEAIPVLWNRASGPIRIWSAGCAGGEEAYSLAALFHDHAARAGQLERISRVQITGSDIDEESLRTARRGVYAESQLVETPPHFQARYFEITRGQAVVGADLRGMVRFERRDVILDREPDERFDLIVCRNVIIYLEERAQRALLERFHRCSHAGAFLMLGKVEAVLGQPRTWFRPAVVRARLYRHAG